MIGIDTILKAIEMAQNADVKKYVTDKLAKIGDIKTTALKYAGKVNMLKHDIMIQMKSLDKINADSMKDYEKAAETANKARREAMSKFMRVKARLKMRLDAGKIDGKTYKSLISKNRKIMKAAQEAVDLSYFKELNKAMAKNGAATSMVRMKIFDLRRQIELVKTTRQKHLKVGLAVSIAVLSAAAIGAKVYATVVKAVKNPCRKLDTPEEKSICNIMADIDAINAKIVMLKQQATKCNLTEDPAECEVKIDKQIKTYKKDIEQLKARLDKFGE